MPFARAVLALLLLLGAVSPPTTAAPPPSPNATSEPTAEQLAARIETRLSELSQSTELSDEHRGRLTELYQSAKRFLGTAQEHAAKGAEFQALPDRAPERIQKLKAEQEKVEREHRAAAPPPDDGAADTAALEQRLIQQQTDLATLKGRQDQLKAEKDNLLKRPLQAKEQLTEAKRRIEEIERSLTETDPLDLHPLIAEAQRLLLKARLLARKSEVHMLDQELAVNDLRSSLVGAELDLTERQLALAAEKADRLQDALAERRRAGAESARREAERALQEASGKHPAIRSLTRQNADWGRRLTEAVEGREQASAERESIKQQSRQIESEYHSARQRLEVAGLSDALGQILRDQRLKLPDHRRFGKRARQREDTIGTLGLAKIEVEERLDQLKAPEEEIKRLLAEDVRPGQTPAARESLETDLRRLLEDQERLLLELNAAYGGYLRALVDLDFEERQLLSGAHAYADFLDERLLWIRSARPLGLSTLRDLIPAMAWLLSPSNWLDGAMILLRELAHDGFFTLIVALAGGFLWYRRDLLLAEEEAATRASRRISSDRFHLTLTATAMAILRALPAPILLGYLGWQLQTAPDAGEFPRAIGAGLAATAVALAIVLGLMQLIRTGGVCEVHFRWDLRLLKLFRRQFPWFITIIIPALFLMLVTGAQTEISRQNSLGRLVFIVAVGVFAVFLYRLLWSRQGLVRLALQADPNGWAARLRHLWAGSAVALPVIAAALSAAGYHYSALEIMDALRQSGRLLLAVFLIRSLALRWFLMHRRRLALSQAVERRQALRREERPRAATPQGTAMPRAETPPAPSIDLTRIDEQTRKLINTLTGWTIFLGTYLIWSEFLPAFRVLDDTALWHYTATVEGQEKVNAFTLVDLGLVVAIGILVAVAARNLPGMLEVVLLQRLPITPGSRYAARTIVQYLIVGGGLLYAFHMLGASWSQVQWLVAALSVGLGFGLQEIFANFVSGLIILFERPIRVGDTITVGDVTGTVTRVRIRATTIRDWDRKELVVPNKSFITERVINWTLSDPVTRLVIRIGVAYGTDTERVRHLVMDIVRRNPLVLHDPAPTLYFEEFGDSSLILVLRVYVQELEQRLPVLHELHTAINTAFERQGIRIPFPQRDVHLHSQEPAGV